MKIFVARTIADLAEKQCQIQMDDSHERIVGMHRALLNAESDLNSSLINSDFISWIDLIKNGEITGYRNIPVYVGGNRIGFAFIERNMETLIEAINENRISAKEAYREFEEIHPFEDGNGRVGHVLWAWMVKRYSGVFPMTLPPDVFGRGHE